MKQVWPNYSYSPSTNIVTLTGLNIDQDQLLLIAAPQVGRIMFNFADSAVTASAYTAGANTAVQLTASTASLTTTSPLVIYYDDQSSSVTIGSLPAISGTVTANVFGKSANTPVPLNMALSEEAFNGANRVAVALINSEGYEFGDGVNALPISVANSSVTVNGTFYPATQPVSIASVTIGNIVTISGTVTANAGSSFSGGVEDGIATFVANYGGFLIKNTSVTVNGTFFQGTQPVSIAATVPVSIASVTIGNSVTIANFPATQAVSIASVTIGNTSVTVSPIQGSAGAITSVTATAANSTMIAASATRKGLTVYNAGPAAFFLAPQATCTSVAGGYQVSLNSGDYWECPPAQITLAHTACFASSGSTAGITSIT